MKACVGNSFIEIMEGDISRQETEAIVNAANNSLLGGGGVDGAVHRAAGPELSEYCRKLNGCETGSAKITPGFNLKAKYIIHTVGPIYGQGGEEGLLASCYRSSLHLVQEHRIQSVSFPSISTGAYRYPIEEAAPIAIHAVRGFLETSSEILVRFVLYGDEAYQVYRKILQHISNS